MGPSSMCARFVSGEEAPYLPHAAQFVGDEPHRFGNAGVGSAAHTDQNYEDDDSSISLAERQAHATGLRRLADFPLSVAVAPAIAEAACDSLDAVFDTHLRSFLTDTSNLRSYDELLKLTQRYLGPTRRIRSWPLRAPTCSLITRIACRATRSW